MGQGEGVWPEGQLNNTVVERASPLTIWRGEGEIVGTVTSVAQGATITVAPELTDEILANPGMGWQTFHRTSSQAKNLPDWIPSTIHYARWGWGELEPEPGKLNMEFLDRVLAESRASGQRLAFRVMCTSTYRGRPDHPKWLIELGGRELQCRYGDDGPFPVPDLDDPVVLRHHIDFIQRLGAHYDGHPDIDHVDLGTVGFRSIFNYALALHGPSGSGADLLLGGTTGGPRTGQV
jgi:hypothetical protein